MDSNIVYETGSDSQELFQTPIAIETVRMCLCLADFEALMKLM